VFSLVLAGVLGYLLGSVPTAYLLVRWKSNLDIRHAGSGNVGTLNSFQVTGSRLVGGGVLVLDLLKGAVAVWTAGLLWSDAVQAPLMGGVASVLGHCFPVWLKFKGGRGLATAAGAMFVLGWPWVAIWGMGWAVGFLIWRKVNMGNALASAILLCLIALLPADVLRILVATGIPVPDFRYYGVPLMVIILIRHIEPVMEFIKDNAPQHRE
jgi:glycerol-3-phosphate acyltransferase PlsY